MVGGVVDGPAPVLPTKSCHWRVGMVWWAWCGWPCPSKAAIGGWARCGMGGPSPLCQAPPLVPGHAPLYITSVQPSSLSCGTATCPLLNSASTSSCSDSSFTVSSYRQPASLRPEYLAQGARGVWWALLDGQSHLPPTPVPLLQIKKVRPDRKGSRGAVTKD